MKSTVFQTKVITSNFNKYLQYVAVLLLIAHESRKVLIAHESQKFSTEHEVQMFLVAPKR